MLLTQIENAQGFDAPDRPRGADRKREGFMWLREIARRHRASQALIFGPGDYSATMQMPVANIGEMDENDQIYPGHRWHAVMHASSPPRAPRAARH
jgi:citrate lyase subunit beta/citryl-CoA lyase